MRMKLFSVVTRPFNRPLYTYTSNRLRNNLINNFYILREEDANSPITTETLIPYEKVRYHKPSGIYTFRARYQYKEDKSESFVNTQEVSMEIETTKKLKLGILYEATLASMKRIWRNKDMDSPELKKSVYQEKEVEYYDKVITINEVSQTDEQRDELIKEKRRREIYPFHSCK